MNTPTRKAYKVFRSHGGIMRTGEALAAGVHRRTLYAMRDAGELDKLTRGVYRLTKLPPLGNPDLITVAKRIPGGVVCLISALSFHELTTQIPHRVDLALPRTARHPQVAYPPVHIYRFSTNAFKAGIQEQQIEGVTIRVYSPEKTLADCFKYRNKIGLDVALEALRAYRRLHGARFNAILEYARICRIEKVIRPYLEASI